MQRRILEVPPGRAGITVQALIHELGRFPHSAARGLIDAGCARVGDRIIEDHAERLSAGARLTLTWDPHTRYRPRPRPRAGEGFRVIFEDEEIVVVEKAAGLLSVPSPDPTAPSLAERLFHSMIARGLKKPQLYAVHRLDRQVSGLLVFARSFESLWGLVPQFDTHVARRVYLAIAEGRIERATGTERSRLGEDPMTRRVRLAADTEEGRPAVTHWRVTERFHDATLCTVELETGRRNQIRVHLAGRGHPLVGDDRYGRASTLIRRVALHASLLEFEHPVRGGRMTFRSPVPEDLARLLHHLRSGGRLTDGTLKPLPAALAAELARSIAPTTETTGDGEYPERDRPRSETVWMRDGRPPEREGTPKSRTGHPGKAAGGRHPLPGERDILRGRWARGHREGKDGRRKEPPGETATASARPPVSGIRPAGAPSREKSRTGSSRGSPAAERRRGAKPQERGAEPRAGGEPQGRKTPHERGAEPRARGKRPGTKAPPRKRAEDPKDRPRRGEAGSEKPKPKAAWLKRKVALSEDPAVPAWAKARMGLVSRGGRKRGGGQTGQAGETGSKREKSTPGGRRGEKKNGEDER